MLLLLYVFFGFTLVCMDPCDAIDCGRPVSSGHPEPFRWNDLVSRNRIHVLRTSLMLICAQLHFPVYRFIVPISIVICNDIMAYLFGFFFGRTPLIKVRVQCFSGCLTIQLSGKQSLSFVLSFSSRQRRLGKDLSADSSPRWSSGSL